MGEATTATVPLLYHYITVTVPLPTTSVPLPYSDRTNLQVAECKLRLGVKDFSRVVYGGHHLVILQALVDVHLHAQQGGEGGGREGGLFPGLSYTAHNNKEISSFNVRRLKSPTLPIRTNDSGHLMSCHSSQHNSIHLCVLNKNKNKRPLTPKSMPPAGDNG